MVAIVRKYKSDANVITLARRIMKNVPERDAREMIRSLQAFVRDRIKYVQDPRGLEMIQTPPRTLEIGTGDCDDKAILLATLLETVGFRTRFEAVGMNDGPYSHVLMAVHLGRGWVPLETIIPGVEPGWFPPDATRLMVAHV